MRVIHRLLCFGGTSTRCWFLVFVGYGLDVVGCAWFMRYRGRAGCVLFVDFLEYFAGLGLSWWIVIRFVCTSG